MNYTTEEHTILTPAKTEFIIEVMLQDCDNIYDPKYQYGEPESYIFTAQPETYEDFNKVFNLIEEAKQTIFYEAGPHSQKEARTNAITPMDGLVFSQLNPPSVSGENIETYNLRDRHARIKGYLREDPTGLIYLQANYVDVHALPEQPFVCDAHEYADIDDF